MKIITIMTLALCPLLVSGQDVYLHSKLSFVESFAAYHAEITPKEGGDWSVHAEVKEAFDEKLQDVVSNKDSLLEGYKYRLLEVEKENLNALLDKHLNSADSNKRLKSELLSWKEDMSFMNKMNNFRDLLIKLDFLAKESEAATENPDDVMSVLILESRLKEVSGLIRELK